MNVYSFLSQKLNRVQEAIDAGVVEGSPAVETSSIGIEIVRKLLIVHLEDVDAALSSSHREW